MRFTPRHALALLSCGAVLAIQFAQPAVSPALPPIDSPVVTASDTFEGHEYRLYHADAGFNWFEGQAFCQAEGGYLATMTSPEENEVVAALLDESIAAGYACDERDSPWDGWVSTMFGLYQDNGGPWQWVTGEPVDYFNWGPYAPANGSGGEPEDYGAMFCPELSPVHRGTWNDIRFTTLFDPPQPVEHPGSHQMFCEFEPLIAPVDLRPNSNENAINPRSKGVVPVAILSEGDFDATQVDAATVLLGPGLAAPAHAAKNPLGHLEDVDGDGDTDVVLHFRTRDTGVACGMTELELSGALLDGRTFTGLAAISTVGCR